MILNVEALRCQIPYYLAAQDQRVLVKELNAITQGQSVNYFLDSSRDQFKTLMLQGDGWHGLQLFIFEIGKRRSVQGLVLSNSCDIDPANPRDMPARIIFSPLVKLATYEELLLRAGIDSKRVEAKLASVRAQQTTNMFFLPAGGPLTEDHVIRLDDLHSMPIAAHQRAADRAKRFTLSNTGFYMLVLKLSIHFCRLQERVNRLCAAGGGVTPDRRATGA